MRRSAMAPPKVAPEKKGGGRRGNHGFPYVGGGTVGFPTWYNLLGEESTAFERFQRFFKPFAHGSIFLGTFGPLGRNALLVMGAYVAATNTFSCVTPTKKKNETNSS